MYLLLRASRADRVDHISTSSSISLLNISCRPVVGICVFD